MTSYYFKKYRYAVCLERDQRNYPKRIVGVAIIDLEKLDLAGLVPLPPQVGSYAPLLVLDPTTDLLLCFDLDIAWVVCIDLRAGIDPAKKPWPPPWPHPALGPWHGNDDVMAGRTTQLPQGTPIPPKPANYP